MQEHMRRILRGQASIFAFSSSNGLVRVLSSGAPRVVENQIDAKKVSPDLSRALYTPR